MQTFLPYMDFVQTARCLDRRRLGKQRVEALQLLGAIHKGNGGWANHPAARMWSGYEGALILYGHEICLEWQDRGYKDTCDAKILEFELVFDVDCTLAPMPPWWGDPAFHLSHKSNLVRKMPEHYGKLWSDVPNDLPYVWPQPLGVT